MQIQVQREVIEGCCNIILVPEKAVEEPGYILTLAEETGASAKHQFQAMAQMAYFQYQDGEIDIGFYDGEIKVVCKDKIEKMKAGLLLYRDQAGGLYVLAGREVKVKKLLEAVYRFCTRWVRLDI